MIRLYSMLLLSILFSNVYADNPNLVLLPIDVSEQHSELESEYGAALQEGLQNRYNVFYGAAVEKELEKEYSKIDCDTETCNQNVAIAFNGELIADGAVKKRTDGYLLKLVIRNVISGKVISTTTEPCPNCGEFDVIDSLKKIGRGEKLNYTGKSFSRTNVAVLQNEVSTINIKNTGDRAIVILDTEPSGASIKINGIPKGKTPYQGLDHKVGEALDVEINKEFYKKYQLNLTLQQAITQLDTVQLLKGNEQVLIVPEGRHIGSKLYVDGDLKGTLPNFFDLEPGKQRLRILTTEKGVSPKEINYAVTINSESNQLISLRDNGESGIRKMSNGEAILLLQTIPSGAEVYSDNKLIGITPLVIDKLKPESELSFTIEKQYFDIEKLRTKLSPGINKTELIKLNRGNSKLLVALEKYEPNAKVYVNGEYKGLAPLQLTLPASDYKIQIKTSEKETPVIIQELNADSDVELKLIFGTQPGEKETFSIGDYVFEFITIPGGIFMMGSDRFEDEEEPIHKVKILSFKMMTTEVTTGQFMEFIDNTGYKTDAERNLVESGCKIRVVNHVDHSLYKKGYYWRNSGFEQRYDSPVVCLSINDVNAYIEWINSVTGKKFRLPSEAEWEYAAGARSTKDFPWGNFSRLYFVDESKNQCDYANGLDETYTLKLGQFIKGECKDYYVYTSPVASFKANDFGLYDMYGNVFEYTQDCWNDSYDGAPVDGSAWLEGECDLIVSKGGSWTASPQFMRTATRFSLKRYDRNDNTGFRLVME